MQKWEQLPLDIEHSSISKQADGVEDKREDDDDDNNDDDDADEPKA